MAIYAGNWFHDAGADFQQHFPTVPHTLGLYYSYGIYNGFPMYYREDTEWVFWWKSPYWRLSGAPGIYEPGYWKQIIEDKITGTYAPYGSYVGHLHVTYYTPSPFLTNCTPLNVKGGGLAMRINRLRPNEKPTSRQIKCRSIMRQVAELWDWGMLAGEQAIWLDSMWYFENRYDVTIYNEPYLRFYNVNLVLLQSDRLPITGGIGRMHYEYSDIYIAWADARTGTFTLTVQFYNRFNQPAYTCLTAYQVNPVWVDTNRVYLHTRFLGAHELDTDATEHPGQLQNFEFPEAYPIREGKKHQLLIRWTNDNDNLEPGEQIFAPFTLTHLTDSVTAIWSEG